MDRAITTLFMLESLDGKINSGNNDSLDSDRDWSRIDGVKEGLQQYYDIEQTTGLFSLNTGRVMAKIGINERTDHPKFNSCSFIIIDNKPHLTAHGIEYLCRWRKTVYIVTTNKKHTAYQLREKYQNLIIIEYDQLDLKTLLEDLKAQYGIERLVIQSGGNLNGLFLREDLIDYVNIVIAPLLVGGRDVSTLIDGDAITAPEELNKLKALKLLECNQLKNSYVQLKYEVVR